MFLVVVPNTNAPNPDAAFSTIQSHISHNDVGTLSRFAMPQDLTVGTLDTLLNLSDDLAKANVVVENIVKKVERQYLDIVGSAGEALRVNDKSVQAYLKQWQWDHALYQHQGRQLVDIVSQIQAMAAKVEEDLKTLSVSYTEKTLASTNAVRKRVVNIMTSDIEDFLTPEDVARLDPLDSEWRCPRAPRRTSRPRTPPSVRTLPPLAGPTGPGAPARWAGRTTSLAPTCGGTTSRAAPSCPAAPSASSRRASSCSTA
jgi:V-type H+-transporting ATPase subunit C